MHPAAASHRGGKNTQPTIFFTHGDTFSLMRPPSGCTAAKMLPVNVSGTRDELTPLPWGPEAAHGNCHRQGQAFGLCRGDQKGKGRLKASSGHGDKGCCTHPRRVARCTSIAVAPATPAQSYPPSVPVAAQPAFWTASQSTSEGRLQAPSVLYVTSAKPSLGGEPVA